MAEQSGRQPFRLFRLPWLTNTAPIAPRPPTQQQTTQPTTSTRPPFRPPGVAPPRPSSQPQTPTRAESRPPSPARTASRIPSPAKQVPSQPQATRISESQPPSPNRTARTASQPSTPSQPQVPTEAQPQATRISESQPPSPNRTARIASQPSTPSQTALSQPQVPTEAQPQVPTEAQPQPPPPTQTDPQSRVSSQPSSPSRTALSQPKIPAKTGSHPPSPSLVTTKSLVASQTPPPSQTSKPQITTQTSSLPTSPSQTSKPQITTQTSSLPTSPSLTTTQPQQASQAPSPLRAASQIARKTSSEPPSSPFWLASQVEAETIKISQQQSPLLPAPQLQQTTKAIPDSSSPQSSSIFQTELASTKRAQTRAERFEPPSAYPKMTQSSAEQNHDQDLTIKRTTGYPVLPIDPSKHPTPETNTEEKEAENPKRKPEKKVDKPTPPAEEARKQRKITELLNASGSNVQPKGQLDVSEEETPQAMFATAASEKQKNPIIPIPQNDRNYPRSSGTQGEHSDLRREIGDDISRFVHKMSVDHQEKTTDEQSVSVITLAGDNKGASMHLGSESAKRESSIPIHRGYKLSGDISEATTDGESISKRRFKEDPKTREETESMIYINSNTQSVNNSIILNSSLNEGRPGVHMAYYQNPKESIHSERKTESVEAQKADFNITKSEKLTYEPTVKRRCLRGLFLETSDSDPANPDKPRRHGCRYQCKGKQKGRENGNED
ncbi:hypothetical protein IFM89_017693 [Coptis chinensis]|uniref:Uncharacterized protein n=1 Tax=Coptis chinensis TaxID=261450 RepID=A0A835I5K6_9MAGN|nr:hypothetical protein IFM89_017693 [Coptis chinensis]